MGIGIKTTRFTHLALRVTDLDRARHFYVDTLGFTVVMEKADGFVFAVGSTFVAILEPVEGTPEGDVFSPFRAGLDHLALACEDEAELERVAAALEEAGVENTGAKLDETTGRKYVAFKDPDRIAWEFYMA